MSLKPEIKERLDAFVESSKDLNLVGRIAKSPRLIKLFGRVYNNLCVKCSHYVKNCSLTKQKIEFDSFCEDCTMKTLPILEKILYKINK